MFIICLISSGSVAPIPHCGQPSPSATYSGIPKILSIDSEEIRIAISEQLDAIIETVKAVLEQIPPEFSSDTNEQGVVLTGGGALLKNFDKRISEESGVPITVMEYPLNDVAIGAGRVADDTELLKKVTPE